MFLPKWVKKFKTKGIEIRKRGNKFHAYRVTSKWNKEKKRAQKITLEYLGVITPNGIFKPRKNGIIKGDYEYGHIALLWKLANESNFIPLLKKHYPYNWKEIISFVFLRLIQPLPLKSIQYLHEKTYLSKLFHDISLSPKAISVLLKDIGDDFNTRNNFMKILSKEGKYILIDLTAMFSYSQNLTLLEKGVNKDHLKIPQINLILLFSSEHKVPTYIRLLPGSVRDVSTVKNTIKMADISNIVFIADRGFYSDTNLKSLNKENISYIIPLRRNSLLIPKRFLDFDDVFLYKNRPIIYWKKKRGKRFLYIFEDKLLKQEEETTYLLKIEKDKKKLNEYNENKLKLGKLFLISDIDEDPETIYNLYKAREQIERAFNVFKNLLESDKSYLREDKKFEGYTFLNFLSLYLYYLVLNTLKNKDMNKKYSVKDVFLQLSKIKIYEFSETDLVSEIPKKVKKIVETLNLDIDLLRIKGRS
jgi:transposase